MKTFIRLNEVMRVTGLGRSTIYDGLRLGWFPPSIPLGPKAVGWDLDEITEWQEERLANRKSSPIEEQKLEGKEGNQPWQISTRKRGGICVNIILEDGKLYKVYEGTSEKILAPELRLRYRGLSRHRWIVIWHLYHKAWPEGYVYSIDGTDNPESLRVRPLEGVLKLDL